MQKSSPKIWTLPNLITLLNLTAGTIGVVLAIEGCLYWAGLLVFAAALFDFLDGLSARLLRAYSDTGKQLDSLADMVSFGLLPGIISFAILRQLLGLHEATLHEIEAGAYHWLLLGSTLLIPLFSALRLAKFNVDTRQAENFIGLPTPACAIFYAALGMAISNNTPLAAAIAGYPAIVALLNLLFALLLIAEIPMLSFKFQSLRFSENRARYIFMALVVLLVAVTREGAVLLIVPLYVVYAVLLRLLRK